MRSLFWRILGAFWLALFLTGSLTFLLTRFLNQDSWVLQRHPGLSSLAQKWVVLHESGHSRQAQQLLQRNRHDYRIYTQVFDEDGRLLSAGSRPRAMQENANPPRAARNSNWHRLTQELSAESGELYLFVHRMPHSTLANWQHGHGLGQVLLPLVALFVLTMVSLLLTLSITRPLSRLRHAVHELGETAYQQQHLAELALRRDELGVLAADFNKMGQRLQHMLHSQRQLLRDVSHELRSPLARLQVGLALAERADEDKRSELWPKLNQQCQRLDSLIDEILALARLEQEVPAPEVFQLGQLLQELAQDCKLLAPEQQISIQCPAPVQLNLDKTLLQRALDNLLRNALRFNCQEQPIEIAVQHSAGQLSITLRDHGPGVDEQMLDKLTRPFVRAPGQQDAGYGLGLAIAERAINQLGGQLSLANHPQGGFMASISLPASVIQGQLRT